MIEKHKKRENMKIKDILHKSPLQISFRNGIHSLQCALMPEGALTSFTV